MLHIKIKPCLLEEITWRNPFSFFKMCIRDSIMSDGGWALLGSYAPTVPEVLIVLGVVSVGTLGFMALGSKLLVPATETERVSARAAAAAEPDSDFEPLTA